MIRVRYDGSCATCGRAVVATSQAWWDGATKTLRCPSCGSPGDVSSVTLPVPSEPEPEPEPEPSLPRTANGAGRSAQREFDRRHDARENDVRGRHPLIGGALLAVFPDRQSTQAWAQGAEGERRVGARLDSLRSSGVVVLHDRLVPGTRANIDHIAVAPSGIWVIDTKRYTGEITRRDVGGWRRHDVRLYVAGRDRSKLLGAVARQVQIVRAVVGSEWPDVPIRPALCFIDAVWPAFGRPFELDGVHVSRPKAMAKRLGAAGPCPAHLIERVAARLDERLPPA